MQHERFETEEQAPRNPLSILLQGATNKPAAGSAARRKVHPLYCTGGRAGGSGGSGGGATRKSRSQPASPTGVSKVRPPRAAVARPGSGGGGGGGIKSLLDASQQHKAVTPRQSPQRQQQQQQVQPPPVSSQPPSARRRAVSAPTSPAAAHLRQHLSLQRPSASASVSAAASASSLSGLVDQLDFGCLRLTSPSSTPLGSPERPQRQQQQAPGSAGSSDCGSLFQRLALGSTTCSQDGGPSVPASPDACLRPSSSRKQQQQQQQQGTAQAQRPSAPTQLFDSSQERREEIAFLSDMAAAGAGAWCSQEGKAEAAPAAPAPPRCQRQLSLSPSPGQAQAQTAAGARVSGGSEGLDGLDGQQQPLTQATLSHSLSYRLSSQDVAELTDPWSQPHSQEERAAAAAGAGREPTSPSPWSPSLQYGRPPVEGAPPADVGWHLAQERQLREQQRQRRDDEEDALVASTCPLPQLIGVRDTYSTQREAFAAADSHNRCMPLLRPAQVVQSRVALEELLPTGAAAALLALQQQQQQQTSSAATSGAAASSSSSGAGAAGAAGGTVTGPECSSGQVAPAAPAAAAASHGSAQPSQQQQEQEQPADFLARQQQGVLPAADCDAYNHAPLLKRQRQASDDEASRQQEQERLQEANRAARAQYAAAMKALQSAPTAVATSSAAAAGGGVSEQPPASGAAAALLGGRAASATAAGGSGAAVGSAGAGCSATATQQLQQLEEEGRWHEEAVRTFCVERKGRSGAYYRSFTAASYPAVWDLFRRHRAPERHWYEVIREGRPAHLYFDLEYPAPLNPQADGDALVDRLLVHVAAQLRLHYDLGLDPRCVYELDSTTPDKFSRHLTLRLPGHAFANNHAMGKFVAQVVAASGSELTVTRSRPADGTDVSGSVVDTAVYTKNRHWRISYCCKGGKEAALRPTRRFATARGATTSTACVFLDTLVCNVDPRARLLQMPDPLPTGGGSRAVAVTVAGAGLSAQVAAGLRVAWRVRGESESEGGTAVSQEQAEELKRLAEAALPFVEQVATQRAGGAAARARTLAFCGGPSAALVAYSMVGPGSHYCENVGRAHASNHVFFVLDFRGGVYAQKCHDPDCARFRSGWMPLPLELCLPGALGVPPPSPAASSKQRSGGSASGGGGAASGG